MTPDSPPLLLLLFRGLYGKPLFIPSHGKVKVENLNNFLATPELALRDFAGALFVAYSQNFRHTHEQMCFFKKHFLKGDINHF